MDSLTTVLSRALFGFTISAHIIFPAFSIGLATFLAVMEGCWLKTKNPTYLKICKFWTKVFALTFGMGIVSGIVMEFEFGMNWARFTHAVGGVLGALFTWEVFTAFFIEAGFLGVMLFGWEKVGAKLHYFATLLVWIGVSLSAYWIMDANTFMQHPWGYQIDKNGLYTASSWAAVIFNPMLMNRYFHMMLAAYISAGFAIISICSYYLVKNRHQDVAKKCLKFVWVVMFLAILVQIYLGDNSGRDVLKYQPLKTAAMEGIWNTQRGAPFLVLAYPDQNLEKNTWALKIPHGAALINTHQWNGRLVGLKSVPRADRPQVGIVFYTFRLMVYDGFFILLISIISCILLMRKKLFQTRWWLKLSMWFAPLGFIALLGGWLTTEEGRQPWIIYKLMRVADASSIVHPRNVISSLVVIFIAYGIIFGIFYFYFLNKVIQGGPEEARDLSIAEQPFRYMTASTKEGAEK